MSSRGRSGASWFRLRAMSAHTGIALGRDGRRCRPRSRSMSVLRPGRRKTRLFGRRSARCLMKSSGPCRRDCVPCSSVSSSMSSTCEQIASQLGIPRGTVASRLRRARKQVRQNVAAIDLAWDLGIDSSTSCRRTCVAATAELERARAGSPGNGSLHARTTGGASEDARRLSGGAFARLSRAVSG